VPDSSLVEKAAAIPPRTRGVARGRREHDAITCRRPHRGLAQGWRWKAALQNARTRPDAIDYITLHGTGTPANDADGDKAVVDLFGRQTRCKFHQGLTGHTLGALCGAIEAIILGVAIANGFLPRVNTRNVDPAMGLRYLLDNETGSVDRWMSNASIRRNQLQPGADPHEDEVLVVSSPQSSPPDLPAGNRPAITGGFDTPTSLAIWFLRASRRCRRRSAGASAWCESCRYRVGPAGARAGRKQREMRCRP